MLRAYATDPEMRINLGIRRRLAPLLGNDRRKIELLNALLFSLPGTPVIYYGDEIGMGDNVYLGDRNGVRTPMQWSADRNAGFSVGQPAPPLHAADHRAGLPLRERQRGDASGQPGLAAVVDAPADRPAQAPPRARARHHRVPRTGEPPRAGVRPRRLTAGEQTLLCVANLSRLAQQVELDLRQFAGSVPVEVFGQNRFAPIGDRPYPLTLAPYGFFWFALDAGPVARSGRWARPRSGPPPGSLDRRAAASGVARAHDRALAARAPLVRRQGRHGPRRHDRRRDPPRRRRSRWSIVRTSFTEGDDHRYAVPLLHTTRGAGPRDRPERPGALVALLDDGGHRRRHGRARGRRHRRRRGAASPRPGKGRRAVGHRPPPAHRADQLADDPRDVHPLGVEQSNSSVLARGAGDRQADPPAQPGREPRRHAAHPPAAQRLRARAGRGRHARRRARRRRRGQRRRRPRRHRQRGRPLGVEPGPPDPRGRAPRVRARSRRPTTP